MEINFLFVNYVSINWENRTIQKFTTISPKVSHYPHLDTLCLKAMESHHNLPGSGHYNIDLTIIRLRLHKFE